MIKINRHGQMRGKPWRRIILLALLLSFALLTSCSKPLEKLSAAELLNLGEKYLLEQDYKQAAVYFEKLIEIEPKSSRGYIGLAKAYVGLEQREDAIAVLQRGLEALPDDPDILAMLDTLIPPEPAPSAKPEPLPPSAKPEPEPSPSMEGKVIESDWPVSDLTYSFIWEEGWGTNRDALGGCRISFTVNGDLQGIHGILIGAFDESLTEDQIKFNAEYLLPIWKEDFSSRGSNSDGFDGRFPGQGFPIFEEDLGKRIQVGLIVFNSEYEYLGKIVVEVEVPANPA